VVRVAVIDLERRMAVVRADDAGREAFPHALRGTLAAMLTEPRWHVVVALGDPDSPRAEVSEVLRQAAGWASEGDCRLSVASLRELSAATLDSALPPAGEPQEA